MNRKPAVAGQFYSSASDALHGEVKSFIHATKKKQAIAAICPHAGFYYSGQVAGLVYSSIDIADVVIILGPNHTGGGLPHSIMTQGIWEMPNGPVTVNQEIAAEILSHSNYLKPDEKSQLFEHSIEVQLPFIQYMKSNFTIVPITLMYSDFDVCLDIAYALAKTLKTKKTGITLIASSDMTHFEPHDQAKKKDLAAINYITNRDPEGLFHYVKNNNISMCGIMPAATVLEAANNLGATTASLVKYMTSGEISGDFERVVGYAGIIIY